MAETTLFEQSKLIKNPQAVEVANVFATSFVPMGLLSFETISGFHKPLTIVDTLPTVAPRDFLADYTSDFGKSSTYNIPWKNYGGKLEIDKALRKGNPSGAVDQELMQIQAIAKKWTTDMFEGAGGTSLLGIKSYIANLFPGQKISAGSTSGGDLLTMAMMDDAMDQIADSGNKAIFVTKKVRQRLTYLARTNAAGQQNIQYTVDAFGAKVLSYYNVPIYVMLDAYTGNDLLSTTELDDGAGASTTSSVYVVSFGSDTVTGFSPSAQTLEIETANPGTHAEITRLEMNAGIAMKQPRAAVRISSVKQSVT
jgi:hypothetical protein